MIYLMIIAGVFFLRLLLKLNWPATGILLVLGLCMLPFHKKEIEKRKKNEARFFETCLYLDTMLYAFLKQEKIEGAIRDVGQTLPDGSLQYVVQRCHERLLMISEGTEGMEEALAVIEEEFPCKRIRDMHRFMVHVEYYGGEIEKPVNLLLEDKNRWENRIKRVMEERKKKMTDIILSVLASVLICSTILYLPVLDIDISSSLLIQMVTLVVLLVDDLVLLRAQKYLSVDWIALQLTETEEYYIEKMHAYKNYDEKKERKISLLTGGSAFLVSTGLFLFGKEWASVFGLMLSVFFLQQHRIGRSLLKRTLIREINYAFPNWLLDLVLLLQSENEQMALQKSKNHVPGVLKEEWDALLERLELEPEASAPYHMFLQDFYLPQVHSAMSGLYGISIGNSGKGDRQMAELAAKNLVLLDMTETKRLSDSGSGMYLLFLIPVLTASFQMILDMTVLLMYFMQAPML